jgi:hypothetical protein
MFFNLALKGVDSRIGVKPDAPYRVDPFCRYSGAVNVKASAKIVRKINLVTFYLRDFHTKLNSIKTKRERTPLS